jgi:hypothetical protein
MLCACAGRWRCILVSRGDGELAQRSEVDGRFAVHALLAFMGHEAGDSAGVYYGFHHHVADV